MENIKDLDFYTIEQAAQRVGFGERYLMDAINDKSLKAYKTGKKLFILHSDLIEFVKSGGDALENKAKSNLPNTKKTTEG